MANDFIDYYAVLGIAITSTQIEIKAAFKKMALLWHPDRNKDKDTTRQMQDINEAYTLLNDEEARNRYDKEYQYFMNYKKAKHFEQEQKRTPPKPSNSTENAQQEKYTSNHKTTDEEAKSDYQYPDYTIQDDILSRWIANARKQAEQAIRDLKGMSKAGAKAGKDEFIKQVIIALIIAILFGSIKACG